METQQGHVEALEKRNDTMQLILLSLVLVGLSYLLSSILPYALVFFLGVLCGRAGFVSLMRHGSVGASKVMHLLFYRTRQNHQATSPQLEQNTIGKIGNSGAEKTSQERETRQHRDFKGQVVLHDNRASHGDSPHHDRKHQSLDRKKRSRNSSGNRHYSSTPQDSSDDGDDDVDDEPLEIDTSQYRSRSRQRNRPQALGDIDLGHVMTRIGSQMLKQWISD